MTQPVIRHPSTVRREREAAGRFLRLRDWHQRASRSMWAGMLAASFSDNELLLLGAGFLSPADVADLKKIGRMADASQRKREGG